MRIHPEKFEFQGESLHRLTLKPPEKTHRALLFFHGQGDYIERYQYLLVPLVKTGTLCVLTDLPGHGLSSGKRGHVPGYAFIDQLQDATIQHLRESLGPNCPLGLGGHSMGGHLVLRELLRKPDLYHFAWASSPLLRFRQGPTLQYLLTLVAKLFPWITWSTGVTEADCRPDGTPGKPIQKGQSHAKISLGWGTKLQKGLAATHAQLLTQKLTTPLLITQGTADPVCPPQNLQTLLTQTPSRPTIRWAEERLHEPFEGPGGENLIEEVRQWISLVLPPPDP